MTTPTTLEQALQARIEQSTETATRILTHYLRQAMPDLKNDPDVTAEMRTVVEAIVDAAVLTVQRNKLQRDIRSLPPTAPALELLHGGTHHEDEDPIEQNNRDWEEARGRKGSRRQALDPKLQRELDEKL